MVETEIKIVYLGETITSQKIDEQIDPEHFQIQFSNGKEIIWGTVKDLILDD